MENVDNWICENFQRRECVRVIPVSRESTICGCGRPLAMHYYFESEEEYGDGEMWDVERCTAIFPTDAYGILSFRNARCTCRGYYARLDVDTDPEDIWTLLVDVWNLEPPKLIITVHGDGESDGGHLSSSFIRAFKKGLEKAAKTTSTWIITSGYRTALNKHVAAALQDHRTKRVNVIGFPQWGTVRNNEDLLAATSSGSNVAMYSPDHHSHFGNQLCDGHNAFILVDDGTVGRDAACLLYRRRFEDMLRSKMKTGAVKTMQMVCLTAQHNRQGMQEILHYLSVEPRVPIICCANTGPVSNWIASICEEIKSSRKQLSNLVVRRVPRQILGYLGMERTEANRVVAALTTAVRKFGEYITVYRNDQQHVPCTGDDTSQQNDLDVAILNALLSGYFMSRTEKLNLTIIWGREDLAKEILEKEGNGVGPEWPPGSLDQAMMNALMHDRVDIVNLLLTHGMIMDQFLTIARLEQLYNADSGPPNTLRFIQRDVVKGADESTLYRLSHIGLIIEKLMGFGYRSTYCRREFRKRYKFEVHRKSTVPGLDSQVTVQVRRVPDAKRPSIFIPYRNRPHFAYPYHELFIWAVLTNRKHLAICFWQNGFEQLAKALVGHRLYQSLAHEAEEDYLEMDVCQQLQNNANEFTTLAYDFLAHCYEIDDDMTLQLLTYELRQFSKSSCITLASYSKNEAFVAHQSCQLLLADLWQGGLRLRKSVNFKVLACIFFPFMIPTLTFKTREELQLQAQTAEEHKIYRGVNVNEDETSKTDQTEEDEDYVSSVETSDIEEQSTIEALDIASSRQETPLARLARRLSRSPSSPGGQGSSEQQIRQPDQNESLWWTKCTEGVHRISRAMMPRLLHWNSEIPLANLRSIEGAAQTAAPDLEAENEAMSASVVIRKTSVAPPGSFYEHAVAVAVQPKKPMKRYATSGCIEVSQLHNAAISRGPPVVFIDNRKKTRQPLDISRRIMEFYSAPITSFWTFSIGYALFLAAFTYTVLVQTPIKPHWPEYYVIAFIVTFGADHMRKILIKEPKRLRSKVLVFLSSKWDLCTIVACLFFMVALPFRLEKETLHVGRVMYCVNIVFWYIRTLRLMSVYSALSPYIHMYGKMVVELLILSVILFILLASFGILRQSIQFPNEEWQWSLLRNIGYKPYSYLYGSLYPDEITECEDKGQNCVPGYWLTPLFMALYLLLSIVVFMNMMVAAFSYIFVQVNSRAQEITKFQMYEQVMEFEQQSVLPPPFVVFAHIYMIGKFLYKRCWKKDKDYYFEHSLKLFLTPEEKAILHEFERDCLNEFMAKTRERENNTMESRLEYLSDRVELMSSQIMYLEHQTESHRLKFMELQRCWNSSSQEADVAGPSLNVPSQQGAFAVSPLTVPEAGGFVSPVASPYLNVETPTTPQSQAMRNMKLRKHLVSWQDEKSVKSANRASSFGSDTLEPKMRNRSGSAPTRPPSWKQQLNQRNTRSQSRLARQE